MGDTESHPLVYTVRQLQSQVQQLKNELAAERKEKALLMEARSHIVDVVGQPSADLS